MWSSDFNVPNPEVSDSLIQEVESILNVKLPDSYIGLMREKNGAYLEEQLVKVDGDIPDDLKYYIDDNYISMGSISGIGLNENNTGCILSTKYLINEWGLPERLVLFDGDGHTWMALDYRVREIDPPVIFIESDNYSYVEIAKNFSDLINKIVPYESIYDDEGELRNQP